MRKRINFFPKRSEERWIWGLLVFFIGIILATDFVLDKVPAPCEFVYKLGRTSNNLGLAYVSSVMFYWIVVSIPEARKKKHTYGYIYRRTGNVVGDCEAQIQEMITASQYAVPDKKNMTEADFKEILKSINPQGQAPLIIQNRYADWREYFFYHRERSLKFIDGIEEYMLFLESEAEYFHLLRNVKECTYFNLVASVIGHPIRNTDFTYLSDQWYQYYFLCKTLHRYTHDNFSEYSKGYDMGTMEFF